MKKKLAALIIGLTILIMLGGIQATFLHGAEILTTKPGFTFSITHNDLPTINNEGPTNGSTDIPLTPTLNINVNDANGDTMMISWYSNSSSGSWQLFGVNSSVVNGTYHQKNNNFSSTNTKYWWNVSVNDGKEVNISGIYHFTTRP